MITKKTIIRYLPIIIFLVLGIYIRLGIFVHPHNEGDEVIYQALIEQIDSGAGYTLQGHHILKSGVIDAYHYDTPLFFHPPGGIILFYVFYKLFGLHGLALKENNNIGIIAIGNAPTALLRTIDILANSELRTLNCWLPVCL